jgi:hypothetical protein
MAAADAADELPVNSKPLFLWLGPGEKVTSPRPASLLLPVPCPEEPTVHTVFDVVQAVNEHYGNEDCPQFVGGMGETDQGVFFASTGSLDPLEYHDMIQESIQEVKLERHGIPFGAYTTGILPHDIPVHELGLRKIRVCLFAATPDEYAQVTGRDQQDFHKVCSFIANTAEQGVAVEVAVLKPYAEKARELAMSLGAQEVHVH